MYVKYLINKYFQEKEIKKDIAENKILTNILTSSTYAENFREKLIENLNNYEVATIIYAKTNLNEELDLIIEKYNYIPEIKNH